MMEQTPYGTIWPASPIEAKFQQADNPYQVPETPTTSNLVQFGYNFFTTQVSTFAPVGNVPVGDDYVIGPGDEIDILMWGRVNTVLNPTVDREGMIQVSELGPIQVAGLTFAQAKKLIESKATQITGVQVDVTMGQLRTINITVAGDVTQPGSYTDKRAVPGLQWTGRGGRSEQDRQLAPYRSPSRQPTYRRRSTFTTSCCPATILPTGAWRKAT